MELPALTILTFVAAVLVALGRRMNPLVIVATATLVPLVSFLWFVWQIQSVYGGSGVEVRLPWFQDAGIWFSMRLDGLALLFSLLITGIGTLILLYTSGYFKGSKDLARILALLLFFLGSMLGLVLSDNLILLFVFWELTSVSSYLLIGFKHEDAQSRRNALQALLITGAGGLALLAGFLLLGKIAGTFEISSILANPSVLKESPLLLPTMIFLLLGAITKSAQFPFHFWLPNAMSAPTPVSAYLHSATMVKAGVFLLARLNPAFADVAIWSISLVILGGITMLLGGALGLLQTDLKKILAYTTLSVLGVLVLLLGIGTELALQSAVFFLLGHALYKASLFLCAGNVDHACGTRDVLRLRGLRAFLPLTAAAALLAALSKSGFPPFFGFLGKEYTYKSGVALEEFAIPILVVVFLVNAMLLALAFKAGVHPFFGKYSESRLDESPHPLPGSMWIPPFLLGVIGLVIGIFPSELALPLVAPAVASVLGQPVQLEVALWHGVNLPLILTVFTFACGFGIYAWRRKIWEHAPRVSVAMPVKFDPLYDRAYQGLLSIAKWQTGILQNGKLHRYLATVVFVTTALLIWKLSALRGIHLDLPELPFQPLIFAVMLIMGICAVVAVTAPSRLASLAMLGMTGYGMAFLFAHFGAPDLAITQVLIETLTVVFFMAALQHLPRLRELANRRSRFADACLAGLAGALVSILILLSLHIRLGPTISLELAERSYVEAYGRNVVNVILVDFRALDTLGELVVLGIAALGVYVLLSVARRKKPAISLTNKGGNPQ
jgi:multicomponent Na+:H+ antiporter subunit A